MTNAICGDNQTSQTRRHREDLRRPGPERPGYIQADATRRRSWDGFGRVIALEGEAALFSAVEDVDDIDLIVEQIEKKNVA